MSGTPTFYFGGVPDSCFQNPSEIPGGCKVGTSRISHMQGLMVVGFIVDEILRVGFKNDKVTGA